MPRLSCSSPSHRNDLRPTDARCTRFLARLTLTRIIRNLRHTGTAFPDRSPRHHILLRMYSEVRPQLSSYICRNTNYLEYPGQNASFGRPGREVRTSTIVHALKTEHANYTGKQNVLLTPGLGRRPVSVNCHHLRRTSCRPAYSRARTVQSSTPVRT
jgi:hypothetical protein